MPSLSGHARRKAIRRRFRTMAAEPLESRQLLAAFALPAKSPIDAVLTRLGESPAVPVGQGPIDRPALIAAANKAGVRISPFGELGVTITAADTTALTSGLEALGFTVTANLPSHHLVEGYLPATSLDSLLDLRSQGLLGVRASYAPLTRTGVVADQADLVQESARVRATLPTNNGSGVKIGVLSDSYNRLGGAAADVTSQDLPNVVQVLEDSIGADEGRAMLQLIHDVAPGASLAFATANGGEANLAQNIRDLAAAGVDIIADDVGYITEPMFQDGIITQAVDDVVANDGVAYFSAAGNFADNSYEVSTNIEFDVDPQGFGPFGPAKCFDFDLAPGPFDTDFRQSVNLQNGQSIQLALQWDDPFYTATGVDTDLDISLVKRGTNVVVAGSYNENVIDQNPSEIFSFTNDTAVTGETRYEIIINHNEGPLPQRMKYVDFRGQMAVNEFDTNSSTIYGHAAAANGIAVGAAAYYRQDQAESFSSRGRTTILFNADGTPLGLPEVRATPQMTAIDDTNTTFFGAADSDGDGRLNFSGTSAAAAHAAAVAALIKQANPSFTPQQIYQRMQDTAIDLGTPGWDRITGAGLVNAYDAVVGAVQPASLLPPAGPQVFTDGFETPAATPAAPETALSQAWETNATGAGRIAVTTANTPFAGAQHLALDAFLGPGFSLNEAILHLNLDNHINVSLSFQEKETNDDDHPMPPVLLTPSFTGSFNGDGVSLSVDGDTWYTLFDLTGPTESTGTYQLKTADLSTFAAANGLTLGSDVRIKFQQYGSAAATNDGIFFDDISVTGTLVNTGPTAVDDDNASGVPNTPEDTPLVISQSVLTANDTDLESDALRVTAVANAVNGTVSLNGGVITFTPNPDSNGPASFDYTVTDENGFNSDVGAVSFNVTPVNDVPVAINDALTGATENTPFVVPGGDLTGNDTDTESDPLTVTAAGNAVHGTVSVNSGVVTFTPDPGYHGPASFEYTVSDGVDTDIGLATFTIAGVNDAPTANAGTLITDEDIAANGQLTSSDPEGDVRTYRLAALPTHGRITSFDTDTGAYTYTPLANYHGADSFAFTVNDGALDSAAATIDITVASVNDSPVLTPSTPSLGSIAQGATNPSGKLINNILAGLVTDADIGAVRGIAVMYVTGTTNGQWQYKYDALGWTNFPAVSQSAALLLPGNGNIRFVPTQASFAGQVSINYRAWDQTQGGAGGAWDVSNKAVSTGGSTAFSAKYDVGTLRVNRPPVLTQTNTSPVGYQLNSNPGVNFMIDASFNKTKLVDRDSPNFNTGVLRVHTSAGKRIGDRITLGWNFSIQGTNVVYQGVHIGDVLSDGVDGRDLAIKLNTAATVQLTEQLINAMRFKTVAGIKGTRTLQVKVGDGDGATSNTLTRQVIVN